MDFSKTALYDSLISRSKAEVDDIRRLLNCNVKSSLNKADMTLQVTEYLLNNPGDWLIRFPMNDLSVVKGLVSIKPGARYNAGLRPYPTVLELMELIESETDKNGNTIMWTSAEMHRCLKSGIDSAVAYCHSHDYPVYETYVSGMLTIYGIVRMEDMIDMLYSVEKMLDEQRETVHGLACNALGYIRDSLLLQYYAMEIDNLRFYTHPALEYPEKIYFERNSRKDAVRAGKKFPLEEIRKAGAPGPFITAGAGSSYGQALMRELEGLGLTGDAAKMAYHTCFMTAQDNPAGLIKYLSKIGAGKFSSMEHVGRIMNVLMAFSNNMPRWILDGYSSSEV